MQRFEVPCYLLKSWLPCTWLQCCVNRFHTLGEMGQHRLLIVTYTAVATGTISVVIVLTDSIHWMKWNNTDYNCYLHSSCYCQHICCHCVNRFHTLGAMGQCRLQLLSIQQSSRLPYLENGWWPTSQNRWWATGHWHDCYKRYDFFLLLHNSVETPFVEAYTKVIARLNMQVQAVQVYCHLHPPQWTILKYILECGHQGHGDWNWGGLVSLTFLIKKSKVTVGCIL